MGIGVGVGPSVGVVSRRSEILGSKLYVIRQVRQVSTVKSCVMVSRVEIRFAARYSPVPARVETAPLGVKCYEECHLLRCPTRHTVLSASSDPSLPNPGRPGPGAPKSEPLATPRHRTWACWTECVRLDEQRPISHRKALYISPRALRSSAPKHSSRRTEQLHSGPMVHQSLGPIWALLCVLQGLTPRAALRGFSGAV